ncbi:MAG: alpha-D-ribose 1-methylphosphonate 5-triphosphate diphosphatase [Coriobacteriales bacterium]|jgi:alpha-D-ribose 1-methylphosphonate 5-triphosphate diphosphatase|nr:alpha-D-ribose 1-methylphosphonate 5-triphosphate diphosphatase [Coriobacteriales bacterium]
MTAVSTLFADAATAVGTPVHTRNEAPAVILRGGTAVLADRLAPAHDVVVSGGRIQAIEPTGLLAALPALGTTVIDARGCYVAPGLIDIHSDYIETIASPRPSVVMDLRRALYETDRALVSHGITTMYHSLSVYQTQIFEHKPIRLYENVMRLVEHISAFRASETLDHLIRHRLHMRVELDAVGYFNAVEELLRRGSVDLLSFMDHTPGQGQYRDLEVFARTIQSYRGSMSEAAVRELALSQQRAAKFSYGDLARLAALAHEHGVPIASHDDDSIGELASIHRLGARISEFPVSLEVGRRARELGMHTLAGAPNVVLGYSHSGNLSARESVCADVANILCSDYYPAALLQAVFTLQRCCGIELERAFALVTLNPARAVGIDHERGELAVGKRADLLLIRKLPHVESAEAEGESFVPVVEAVFVEGRPVFQTRYPQAGDTHWVQDIRELRR